MKVLRYQGIYILKSTEPSCASWKQYLIDRGLDPDAFTIQ